jgi:hypothetical protein
MIFPGYSGSHSQGQTYMKVDERQLYSLHFSLRKDRRISSITSVGKQITSDLFFVNNRTIVTLPFAGRAIGKQIILF